MPSLFVVMFAFSAVARQPQVPVLYSSLPPPGRLRDYDCNLAVVQGLSSGRSEFAPGRAAGSE